MSPVTKAGGVVPSGSISDGELASPNNVAYKTLLFRSGQLADSATAATRVFLANATVAIATNVGAAIAVVYLDPADYAVSGLTTRYRVLGTCLTNATAPATTFTIGLYPVTASAGAADTSTITLDTVVSGSTVAFASPDASTRNQANSGDLTAPAAGFYILGIANAAQPTADSLTTFSATLQVRNT